MARIRPTSDPAAPPAVPAAVVDAFIAKWSGSQSSERANKDSFLIELCALLGVPAPDPKSGHRETDDYVFERDVPSIRADGESTLFIDLYKKDCFVLEAKQGSIAAGGSGVGRRETPGWHAQMQKAYGQALGYAKSFDEPPPFVVVCDLGYCFDLYASFDRSGVYRPFPTAQQSRLFLKDLGQHLGTLRALFTDPLSLDPARYATRITREVAGHLAELAKDLEAAGHQPELVAKFLMRCIFTMFAEDVALLPPALFKDRIQNEWLKHPERFPTEVRELWEAMDQGTSFGFLGKLLRFNGGLFKGSFALPIGKAQLQKLLACAACDWSQVEPSIFGTLLERALSPQERHKLGAHYTPRAYVERLVRPTIEEPLRAEWDAVQVVAHRALENGKPAALKKARAAVVEFHTRLCNTRVLDPACGTGNFLYVAFDLFKRLEGEVLQLERQLTGEGETLGIEGLQISPKQFLGIEVKPWAKQIADLVLWIGYLQWHFKTSGGVKPPEPVLKDYGNIQCRDAVLEWDDIVDAQGDDGKKLTRWDGVTTKTHPVTGEEVPDDTARIAVKKYVNPRPAKWPEAEFVVGNPPYVGNKRMRELLGDGYVEALREAHGTVPGSVDFVMYWWDRAARALLAKNSKLRRFGFITTNSITQTFNRKVLATHMEAKKPLHLAFAIPDHPWVDSEDGADLRVALTVSAAGREPGDLQESKDEQLLPDGAATVLFRLTIGLISPDLRVGGGLSALTPLRSNRPLCLQGCKLVQQRKQPGFLLTPDERKRLGGGAKQNDARMPRYVVGGDLTNDPPRERYVLDFFGFTEAQARQSFAGGLQILIDRVKPFRDMNKRSTRRGNWWLFGENAPKFRRSVADLARYIATSEVAKHRVFAWVPAQWLADGSLATIAHDDAFVLGVLSSSIHLAWSLATGGTLEDRPRYQNGPCFDPFPFPAATDAQKSRIRALGEELDAHRKRQQAAHPELTITGMYNVLEKLRSGEALNAKDKVLHAQGLVSVLKDLHDRLDAAVFDAYGWPATLTDEQLIEKLVALNAARAAEEKKGLVRWLRPEFQNPAGEKKPAQGELDTEEDEEPAAAPIAATTTWPKGLFERMAVVRDAVAAHGEVALPALTKALAAKTSAEVEEVLDGLTMLGQLLVIGKKERRRWTVAGRRAA